jgi:hypothetical protein
MNVEEELMGSQVYHKLCLKCNQCGKRLDPGGLVQHDELVCHYSREQMKLMR